MTPFSKYFDKVSVINLPSRPDRLRSILMELQHLGFDRDAIDIPPAPVVSHSNGFPSPGVFGNYLSHLEILKRAEAAGPARVLILEDDAIFSRAARDPAKQKAYVEEAGQYDWSMWFLGHKLRRELRSHPLGVIPNQMEFHWAHAYAVQRESLREVIDFLETLMARPADHPQGRMYIDGAFYHYRAEASSKPCLVSNPALSIQKGSDSNLAGPADPGRISARNRVKQVVRDFRDTFWRWTNIDFR